MKKLGIYYVAATVVNVGLLVAFWSRINLHPLSLLPVFFIALMIYNAILVGGESKNSGALDTAYAVGDTVRLLDAEQACQFSYLKYGFLICIPLEIPLIFFLPWYWKLIAILPFVLSYMIGGFMFKTKMGKAIKNRIDEENKELAEQIKREESGLK